MSEITPVVRKNSIIIQELDKELLLYDLTTNRAFSLNEIPALVWQLSDGNKSVNEIAEIVSRKFNTYFDKELVWLALGQMKKEDLLEKETEIPVNYQGATRREVIRKIGFASLVSLPVIASIIAPTAALAQSSCGSGATSGCACIPLGCSCVVGGLANSGNCASGCCNFPNASAPGTCVPMGTVGLGSACVRACQCASTCCGGGVCQTTGKAPGTPCVAPCECTINSCAGPGGTCT